MQYADAIRDETKRCSSVVLYTRLLGIACYVSIEMLFKPVNTGISTTVRTLIIFIFILFIELYSRIQNKSGQCKVSCADYFHLSLLSIVHKKGS